MKSRRHLATAVRKENGKIVLHRVSKLSLTERTGIHRIPLVRGAFVLFETMIVGMRELNWSSDQALGKEEKSSGWAIGLVLLLSLGFALALFKLLPLYLASIATRAADGGNWMLNLLDGLFKMVIFVLYILLISLMPDVVRLFQYHGAEHKAVNCYEAGKPLTAKHAKGFTLLQPRCGTTFVIYVFALSIFLYALIPFGTSFWLKYLLRLVLLPVIAGIAYEWVRFAGKYYRKSMVVRAISLPGMAFQRLTTREPNLAQLAVAIAALKDVLGKERRASARKAP